MIRVLLFILIVASFTPVLWQLSQAVPMPGWRTTIAEITSIKVPGRKGSNVLGYCRFDYQFKVAGRKYEGAIISLPLYFLDALSLYNKYRDWQTIVYYNPGEPSQSRVTDVASEFCGLACLNYGAAFCMGLTLLTLAKIAFVFGVQLNTRGRVSSDRLPPVVKTPLHIGGKR